jgi:hypothetical protein
MINSYPEEENLNITDNYYSFLKQKSEDYLKYITYYKIATNEYLKKLSTNHEKYNQKLIEERDQKELKKEQIIKLVSTIPKIIEQQIINIGYFVQGVDKNISKLEQILREKNTEFTECLNNFKDTKNDLIKKYRDVEKIKSNFMSNISSVEETIHKIYTKNNKKKKNNSKLKISIFSSSDSNNESVTLFEDQVNSSIQKTKKIEDEYKYNFDMLKKFEKYYIEIAEKSKEKSRKILCEITNSLKDSISEYISFLQSCFKMPLSEIDLHIQGIISYDGYSKFDEIIKSSYINDNHIMSINPEKYTPKIFQTKNSINKINSNNSSGGLNDSVNSNNSSSSSTQVEDELDINQEEEIFTTIKKMTENFELLDNNNFDLEVEEEKLRCKYLSLKILSFAPTNKLYSNQIPPITDEEVEEIDIMLLKKQNRVIFFQKLSQFRTRGIFEIPEREYNILSRLFNKISKLVESEKDYESAINIIILSQTYYTVRNNKKEYLQNILMNNEYFKTKKFWENFIRYSIDKEIISSKKSDEINGVINQDEKETEENYSNIVFAQLVPLNDNMIDFGININIIEEIISPIIKQYKISQELAEVIYSVINNKKLELQNNINNEININQINEK